MTTFNKDFRGLLALFPVRKVQDIEDAQMLLSRYCNTSLVESDNMEVVEMENYLATLTKQLKQENDG